MQLVQEFNFEVIDRRRTEKQVADHLSILKYKVMVKLEDGLEIDESFLDNKVLVVSHDLISLLAAYANYLVSDVVPSDMTFY